MKPLEKTSKDVRHLVQVLSEALGGVCERVQFLAIMLILSLFPYVWAAWTDRSEANFWLIWPLIVAFFALGKLYEITKCVDEAAHRIALEDKIAYTVARGETREALEEVQLELSKINTKAAMTDRQKERYSDLLFIRQGLDEALAKNS